MIVDMYFSATFRSYTDREPKDDYRKSSVDADALVVEYMKALPKEARFVFLVSGSQIETWNNWIKRYELKDLIRFSLPRPITNRVHAGYGRNIYLFILSQTPLTEEEYGNTKQS